ncbi:MAG: CmcJ/NvfI family oxidoreductase [Proteobacteria bacterium]|nr:CmcJ/NvfI family oxidoreductase [Pseudomonadota bacterium]
MANDLQAALTDNSGDRPASINYMMAMAPRPARYLCKPPDGMPEFNWQFEARPLTVRDARTLSSSITLADQGFCLRQVPTQVADFYVAKDVLEIYYREIEQFVQNTTGAQKVLAFDYNLRSASKDDRRKTGAFPPATFAHADYTTNSARQRIRDLLPKEEATSRLARRYTFINLWRAIDGPVHNDALCVCDAASVAANDLVATDLIYDDRMGEIYNITFNQNHRWYYYRHMVGNDVLMITNFDSERQMTVPHTGFLDPSVPAGAPPRKSIEVRVVAFF